MTLPDLVQRVKNLPNDTAADQIEKFVLELLGQPRRSEFVMLRMYRRRIISQLKRLR